MNLFKYGISPSDSLELNERYTALELNWFIKKLHKQFLSTKYIEDIQNVSDSVMVKHTGTDKGNSRYHEWRRNKLDLIDGLEKELTVFDKLKNSKDGTSNTVFEKLKYFFKQ